jgi:23S rRNA (adenine-N6)-dimethyltransferase
VPGPRRPELGQHYLRRDVARRLVELSAVGAHDLAVEIGPGRGAITEHLAQRASRVIAIEIDPRLASGLVARHLGGVNVEVVQTDFLTAALPTSDFTVVANLPFGETSRFIANLLRARPRAIWLVVQREAAERYAGRPWASESLQSLLAKPWWHVEIRGFPRRTDFDPPPAVDAAILTFTRREPRLVTGRRYAAFVHDCFGRDVTVGRCVRPYVSRTQIQRLADDLGFSAGARPSDLTFEQWLGVYRFAARETL